MKLEKGEYTTKGFIEYLQKKHGGKVTGNKFTNNDIAQYIIKGHLPYRYGRTKITSKMYDGVRIIKIESSENADENK